MNKFTILGHIIWILLCTWILVQAPHQTDPHVLWWHLSTYCNGFIGGLFLWCVWNGDVKPLWREIQRRWEIYVGRPRQRGPFETTSQRTLKNYLTD